MVTVSLLLLSLFCLLRATAGTAITRISYGNSVVHLSVCPSRLTARYRFNPRWDRDFAFLPRDSKEFLAFRDKISCCRVRGFFSN